MNKTWVEGPSLPDRSDYGYPYTPFYFCGAQANATHSIVTGGKINQGGTSISDVWFYNWISEQWSPGPNMTTPRRGHKCVGMTGGRVMVVGGIGLYAEDLNNIEIYDPAFNGGGGWYGLGELPEDDNYSDHNELLWNGNVIWVNA